MDIKEQCLHTDCEPNTKDLYNTYRWDYWLQDYLLCICSTVCWFPKSICPLRLKLSPNTYFFSTDHRRGLHNTARQYRYWGISLSQEKCQRKYLIQLQFSIDKILIESTNPLPGSTESLLLRKGRTRGLTNLLNNTGQVQLTQHCYSKPKTSVWASKYF